MHEGKAKQSLGEQALVNAFENAFPNAVHVRCFKQFRDNIESKLKSINLDAASCEEILADIFGTTDAEQTQLGLVDASDESDFASKLMTVEKRWNNLESSGKRTLPSQLEYNEPRVLQLVHI